MLLAALESKAWISNGILFNRLDDLCAIRHQVSPTIPHYLLVSLCFLIRGVTVASYTMFVVTLPYGVILNKYPTTYCYF
jgi:hypothetical protein